MKANSLGYETHVFAWAADDIGEKTANYFYPISITDKKAIFEECLKIKPSAICSIASDLATLTVNYVAEKLNLPCNPTSILEQCTNKYKMRKAMQKHQVKTPKYTIIHDNKTDYEKALSGFQFPIIVKPTDRSGSRGITKVESIQNVAPAVKSAIKESFARQAIIEEYIDGNEYSCECVSKNGKHHFLAFTKKFTTGAPHFIETGHMEPSDIPEQFHSSIKKEIFNALDSLGIKNGASHTEFKIKQNGDFCIIEIGARMGGDCIGSDLVKLSTGNDFVKIVLDVALGNDIKIKKTQQHNYSFIRFILNPTDLASIHQVINLYPETLYYQSPVANFDHQVTDSSSRMGFTIFHTDSQQIAKKIKEILFDE